MRPDGTHYELSGLYDDQLIIASRLIEKIKEFMTMRDLSKFVPLRCTIVGEGGTGKSVLISTITSVVWRMFERTDVIRVAAPTGVAACNIGGETLHRLTASRPNRKEGEYKANSMQPTQNDRLSKKFKVLMGIIVDERSMLSSVLLGETAQKVGETIYEGGHTRREPIGDVPFFCPVGDDYQLPPTINQGAICSYKTDKGKMTQKGRDIFQTCSEEVYILHQNKRLSDDRTQDRDILGRVRVGENILDEDVTKIKSLHIDEIEKAHGKAITDEIKAKSVYIFWTNEKRIRHNLERLAQTNTEENPTAFITTKSSGGKYGKGVNSHFESDLPKTALLCETALAAIDGCNFCPLWGVHNGACGRVVEIVFKPGNSPNNGNQPEYVVLDLPLYSGPAWDLDNPTVSKIIDPRQYMFSDHNLT